MNDLKHAVAKAFDNVIASGAIEQAIEKQLASTITSLINSELREYSEFGKAIGAKVKESIAVNLDRMDLPSYNDLIIKIVRAQMDGVMQGDAAKQLEANMAKLLETAPAEITLEKLVEDFINEHKEDKHGDEFTLRIDRKYGSTYVSLDVEPNKSEYACDFRLAVDQDGKVYSFHLGGKDVGKTMFTGPLYGFERTVFRLYAAKSKLIVGAREEASDFECYFPGHED